MRTTRRPRSSREAASGAPGTAAPPRRSDLHQGRIHRWAERQPDRREPSRSRQAVEIVFDPGRISYRDLLEYFFQIHDPTTKNRQGDETGSYVRSEIFYASDEQRQVAEDTIAEVDASGLWPAKVVTEISETSRFWEAPAEDQDYLQRHPGRRNLPLPAAGLELRTPRDRGLTSWGAADGRVGFK